MLDRVRAVLAGLLLALVLLWPLCHVGLVRFANLNSWKLAGWGMYASMHPNHVGVHAVVLEPGAPALRGLEMPIAVATRHLAFYSSQGTRHLSPRELPEEEGRFVARRLDYVRVMRSRDAMRQIAGALREMTSAAQPDVIFLLVVPRLDLGREVTYTLTTAYLVHDGRVESLGTYSSGRLAADEILGRIESRRDSVKRN